MRDRSGSRGLLTTDPARAAQALREGHLAVIPTETVYGLGGRAVDPHAIARVYAVKGRPADHPLIVHVPDTDALRVWARDVPDYARRLAGTFWPGPLTLVLPRGERAGQHVTGGQDTVGIRVPDHPVTLEVLGLLDDGVAAPSANRFGRVSSTRVDHVLAEMGDRLVPGSDVVLDGGPCRVGVESTIVDCTGPAPRILRPGGVGASDVAEAGEVDVDDSPSPVRAPGTLASHYAPQAQVRLVDAGQVADAFDEALVRSSDVAGPSVGLLALADVPTPDGVVRLAAPASVAQMASQLYAALREADALRLSTVLAVPPDGSGLADAVRDRLGRAAATRPH